MILCTPDWGTTGKHAYWRRLLDHMTVGRTELPNCPIYVPEYSQETMPAGAVRTLAISLRFAQVIRRQLITIISIGKRKYPILSKYAKNEFADDPRGPTRLQELSAA